MARQVIGRFAPSPTGLLHTGSLATAVGSYLMAKRAGGRWLLRLDDLDRPRQMAGAADDIMRTLEQFGLLWDGETARQSGHGDDYLQAFTELGRLGVMYPCSCSRREIAMSASAPHADEEGIAYPGTCRAGMKGTSIRSWRVRCPEEEIRFTDLRLGEISQNLAEISGDFAVRRGDGEFAYQLAVVVDDYRTGVTQVVRGEDLLASTPRQIFLQRLLSFPRPEYCHLPLVAGPGGTKLSKRDNLVTRLNGAGSGDAPRILSAVFRFLGMSPPPESDAATCHELLQWGISHFDLRRLPAAGGSLDLHRSAAPVE